MQHYFHARKLAGTDWGKISSVYNQLWLLNHYVPVPNEILKTFSPPAVVAFAGHMIDHPTRKQPRFPAYMEGKVKESLLSAIQTLNAKIGYCSLACGSDILFAEAMEESGGEVNIWIPFNRNDFIETSLRFAGEGWIQRFERLAKKFPVTYITQEPYGRYDDLFVFLSQVIFGSAVIRANMSFIKPNLLSVLSETDLRQQQGGTRDALMLWPYPERHLNINPDNFIQAGAVVNTGEPPLPHEFEKAVDRPVLYVLFADLTGPGASEQSKLWKTIEEKFDLPVVPPITFETEPSLIASFRSIKGTQELLDLILKNVPSTQKATQLRISLYASPVFIDAPGKKLAPRSYQLLNSFHQLLPAGNVYALARFASVLALDVERFTLDYSGVVAPEGVTAPVEIYAVGSPGLA